MQIVPGSEDDVPGQVSINPRGEEAKERARWEQFDTEYTRRVGITAHFKPGNPPEKRDNLEYPKMLYRTLPSPLHNGQQKCMIEEPAYYNFQNEDQFLRARDAVQHFNLACQRIVGNASEEEAARKDGWRGSVKDALEYHTAERFEKFVQTGHREYENRNMSEPAKAEVAAYDAAHPGHNPEIPEQPKVKRGFAAMTPEQRAAATKKAQATRQANKAAAAAGN